MKNVASLINERKRRLESIDTIAHWQEAIVRWEVRTELLSTVVSAALQQEKLMQLSHFFTLKLCLCVGGKKKLLKRSNASRVQFQVRTFLRGYFFFFFLKCELI